MNDEFRRMKALLEPIGLSFAEGSITNAEIYAYSQGMELVKNQLDKVFGSVFFTLSDFADMKYYSELLRLDTTRFSDDELRSAIKNRLMHGFADYTAKDLMTAFSKIGSGYYSNINHCFLISEVNENDFKELGKFLEAFAILDYPTIYEGEGMTFDEWDEWAESFNYYDSLRLPFNILDYIRRENI